jgi:indole-3-acetate monooxygenase
VWDTLTGESWLQKINPMRSIHHPSEVLNEAITAKIRNASHAAENMKQLHADQLEVIYKEKWFKMFAPKAHGGLGLSLPEILNIEECLSWADGSTAWVVTLCSGAGWFIGFLDINAAREIFNNDSVCIAGSGAATGSAELVGGQYKIKGTWKYASGILYATALTVNCMIIEDGKQPRNADGTPIIASFILSREQIKLIESWNAMGMIATASHSFEVKDVIVPIDRCFIISPEKAILKDPIFQYPFLQLAESTLAVNISGMVVRFIECAETIFNDKLLSKRQIEEALLRLNNSRMRFFSAIDSSWKALVDTSAVSNEIQSQVSSESHNLVTVAMSVVNSLYQQCGLRAADRNTEINRIWRNIHTAGQHSLFSAPKSNGQVS